VTKQQIFDYIEVYYNRKRLHLNIDYRFPEAFKLKKVAKQRAYEIGVRSILGDYVYIENIVTTIQTDLLRAVLYFTCLEIIQWLRYTVVRSATITTKSNWP
jgi:hypothetical protein